MNTWGKLAQVAPSLPHWAEDLLPGDNDKQGREVIAMELTVHITGDLHTMDAGRVLAGLNHLVSLLQRLGAGPVHLTHLHNGSLDTGLRPFANNDTTDAALTRLVDGFHLAQQKPEAPADWNDEAMADGQAAAEKLGSFSAEGMTLTLHDGSRVADRVKVTRIAGKHLKESSDVKRTSIGSVIGQLDSLSVHGRREARLWPVGGGSPVLIRFSEDQLDMVRREVGRRVEARGKLVRDYRDRPISLQLTALTRLKTRAESPRLATGAGIAPDALTWRVGDAHGTA
ncbi:hypothetical protein ABZ639_23925 [Saccharomonospora sp. NPDC006951]